MTIWCHHKLNRTTLAIRKKGSSHVDIAGTKKCWRQWICSEVGRDRQCLVLQSEIHSWIRARRHSNDLLYPRSISLADGRRFPVWQHITAHDSD